VIPRGVEILCSGYFSKCQSLLSVSFGPDRRLLRIESGTFSDSSVRSGTVPRGVRFIGGSPSCCIALLSIMIGSENDTFVIENDLSIDIVSHKLFHHFSRSPAVLIRRDIGILRSSCVSSCELLSSISLVSNSRLAWLNHRRPHVHRFSRF
jgi:hypothetical protein